MTKIKKIVTRTFTVLRSAVKHRYLAYLCITALIMWSTIVFGCVPNEVLTQAIADATLAESKLKQVNFIITENPDVPYEHAVEIVEAVHEASEKYDVKKQVILGLMRVESTYKHDSVSPKVGALGLMQVYPKLWLVKQDNQRDLISVGIAETKEDLLDIRTNILAGTYILRVYLDEAKKKGVTNKYRYALTRYYGGFKNANYDKTMAVVARLKNFKVNKEVMYENS